MKCVDLLTISSSIAISTDSASALRLGERVGNCDSRSNRMSLVLELKSSTENEKLRFLLTTLFFAYRSAGASILGVEGVAMD